MQTAFFLFFIAIFQAMAYPAGSWSNLWLAADPLIAAATVLFHKGAWLPVLLPAIALLLSAALLGRAFCGWACPVGFLADLTRPIARLFKRRPFQGRLGYAQYGLLISVLLASLLAIDALSLLDPLVLFQRSLYLALSLSGVPIVLLLIVGGSLVAPRLWCRVCPLGAVLGLAALASPLGRRVNDRCTRCLKCRACPMGAISSANRVDATACTKCLECERTCPVDAIGFTVSRPSPAFFPDRRTVLAAGASLGLLALSRGVASALTGDASPIRPPGSLAESRFNSACVRCNSCVKACLGRVIRPAGLDMGLDRVFTPLLDFTRGKCERCGTCGTVCPTGAIISLPEANIKIGTAVLDKGTCIAWGQGKKCLICAEVCPVQAVRDAGLRMPRVDADACVGCGSCQLNCPVEGRAIVVSSAGERRRDG